MIRRSALVVIVGVLVVNAKRQTVVDDANEDFNDEMGIDLDEYAPVDNPDAENRQSYTKLSQATPQEHEITIHVEHCPSDAETNTFKEFGKRMHYLYPLAKVTGEVTKSPPESVAVHTIAATIQYSLMAFCWMGRRIMDSVGVTPPQFYATTIEQSPMAPTMLVYMLGNRIRSKILATGAFEVTVNDQLVWSALEQKRMPSWQELLAKLQEAGLEPVFGADDESNFPDGWADAKIPEKDIAGQPVGV